MRADTGIWWLSFVKPIVLLALDFFMILVDELVWWEANACSSDIFFTSVGDRFNKVDFPLGGGGLKSSRFDYPFDVSPLLGGIYIMFKLIDLSAISLVFYTLILFDCLSVKNSYFLFLF